MITTSSQIPPLPDSVDVLIVGGGPVGLAAAITLRVQGVDNILIVDAQEQGSKESKATVLHAGTMTELETIGCAKILSDKSIQIRRGGMRTLHNNLFYIDFSDALSKRGLPFTIGLPQSRSEKILASRLEELGTKVVRPLALLSLEETSNGILAHFESGQTVKAPYVIAADGARSTIRHLLGIQFQDPGWRTPGDDEKQKPESWLVADVQFAEGKEPAIADHNGVVNLLGPEGFFVIIPLSESPNGKGDDTPVWRVACAAESETFLKDNMQRVMDTMLGSSSARISNVLWSSVFKVRSAVADQFVKAMGDGTVILIGDAAHLHSPAGGQGVNLGLRDAIELGQKLAQILTSPSSINTSNHHREILELFGQRRRERAIQVIRLTKVLNFVSKKWTFSAARRLRSGFFWALGRLDFVKAKAALRLSGVDAEQAAQVVGEQEEKTGLVVGLMRGVVVAGMVLIGIVYSSFVDL